MGTTAIASSIDNAWARKCTFSPTARQWDEGRPKEQQSQAKEKGKEGVVYSAVTTPRTLDRSAPPPVPHPSNGSASPLPDRTVQSPHLRVLPTPGTLDGDLLHSCSRRQAGSHLLRSVVSESRMEGQPRHRSPQSPTLPFLTVVSANVRGLRTNIADLSHNFVLRYKADFVAVTETWLCSAVEPTYSRIPSYTDWVRNDRDGRTGGGVAACFRNGLQTQELSINLPHLMEALFFRIVLRDNSGLLLCVLYRPPTQGRFALDLLRRHQCKSVLILGDLNFHLEKQAFDNLVAVQGLVNHVTFTTHEGGGLLDPVLSDLPETNISCQQLDKVGSSDHHAVLTHVQLTAAREEAVPRTIWLWEEAEWPSLQHHGLGGAARRGRGEESLRPHLEATRPPDPVCSPSHVPRQSHRP
ncbi:hypothetical protein E2C01_072570 [Portunus trituberculatus]|uniref:Endonuclease/exonuclease/phosphatase domain-containing protein n=1 Tax=Portunus trituberculatus TaxID=210409 RepID=A0A5B7I722_PORTR|nr:hypothetical protein [Portunus trituberculatus]